MRRPLIATVGGLLLVFGLLFLGQGLGLVAWPESSFMIDQRTWAWRGAGLALAGLSLLLAAHRR